MFVMWYGNCFKSTWVGGKSKKKKQTS